ncbi:MAG: methylmalonyl-CoA carboxyltransferase [Oscillospiraceae bacterium]|nr:methylmalonyl-CoA carboxyltransferase [Oscillospiraceae bacterium]
MDWQKRLDFIEKTRKKAFGEPKSNGGKKTAFERMNLLFDENTFVETNAYVKKRANEFPENETGEKYEGIAAGYGSIGGKLVFAYSQDFSRMSGALSEAGAKKILAVYSMAEKNGAPIVSIFDSSGLAVTEGIDVLAGYGAIIQKASILSGVVPQYSLVCGVCAGGSAVIASISDFVFIEKNEGKIFVNSPFVIKNKTENSGETIGSAEFAAKNGQCAKVLEGEEAMFLSLSELVEYLPSNNLEENVYLGIEDDANRRNEALADYVLTENYDMKQVITEIADNGKMFELYENYAENMICAFISVANATVGVIANQPKDSGGVLCPKSCEKAARFIYVCDNFNIPVLSLVDTAGMFLSESAENSNFALQAAKLASAYSMASVPKITLNIGKAYGAAYTVMGSKGLGTDMAMAYPTAQIGILPPETAVEIIYGGEIANDPEPAKKRAQLLEIWEIEKSSPIEAASGGAIDQIIEPDRTRQMIASAIYLLQSKKETRPQKKYGKLPF